MCNAVQAYHVELKNDIQKNQETKSPGEELTGEQLIVIVSSCMQCHLIIIIIVTVCVCRR